MVPISPVDHDGFLPPLNQCLAGHRRLISWTCASEALSDTTLATNSPALEVFLLDPASVKILSSELDPIAPSSTAAKKEVERRIASLQDSNIQTKTYDIEEFKEDVVWLSHHGKVDELTALRVVLLEWQNRASFRLLKDSGNEPVGTFNATQRPTLAAEGGAETPDVFLSETRKHMRLLHLLLAEKEAILAVSVQVSAVATHAGVPSLHRTVPWFSSLHQAVTETSARTKKTMPDASVQEYIPRCVNAIQACLIKFENGSGWTLGDADTTALEEAFRTSQLVNVANLLRLLFAHTLASSTPDTPASVQGWFSHVDEYGFFTQLRPFSTSQQLSVDSIQILTSIISLSILKLPYTLDYLTSADTSLYTTRPAVLDVPCQKQINDTLLRAAECAIALASPAILAWSIILQTLRSRTSSSQGEVLYDDDLSLIEDSSPSSSRQALRTLPTTREFTLAIRNVMNIQMEEDPIQYLAMRAVNVCRALNVIAQMCEFLDSVLMVHSNAHLLVEGRLVLLELVRQGVLVVEYTSELVNCVQSLLTFHTTPVQAMSETAACRRLLTNYFLHDEDLLMPGLFLQAQSRYPYELKPFLRLCKALEHDANVETNDFAPSMSLSNLSHFTQIMSKDFSAYELVREDENANRIRLMEDLQLFRARRVQPFGITQSNPSTILALADRGTNMCIPRGTIGVVISESKPFVVQWNFAHSGLQYLAAVLSAGLPNSKRMETAVQFPLDEEARADTISLLTARISKCSKEQPPQQQTDFAQLVLEEASDGLDRNEDIISVVGIIFEEELSKQSQRRGEKTTTLLVACMDFLRAVLTFLPGRVWPVIGRCGLLEMDGGGGTLAAVIASVEIPSGRYDLLSSSLALFSAMIDDAIVHSVQRKIASTAQPGRFSSNTQINSGLTDRMISKILESFVRLYLDVLQSSANWKFVDPNQGCAIGVSIMRSFLDILVSVYGFNDSMDTEQKVTSTLSASAALIKDMFLNSAESLKSLLSICGNNDGSSAITMLVKRVALQLLTTLLRISRSSANISVAAVSGPLLKAMPVFVRMYTIHQALRHEIVSMMIELVEYLHIAAEEPPALLGCLSTVSAAAFMDVIADVAMPLQTPILESCIWEFASVVVSRKQQWLATYVLTGETPKTILRATKAKTQYDRGQSLLRIALKHLSGASSISSSRAIPMLEFVASAQNHWAWITYIIANERQFLTGIIDYVVNLDTDDGAVSTLDGDLQNHQTHASAIIAQILAMFLHNSRMNGDGFALKMISIKLIAYYREHALAVPTYSSSLHGHLQKNFAQKFPDCSLTSFKRVLQKSAFGADYFYDVGFASRLLRFHPSWTGSRNDGFRDEVIRANRNLSLVEAQLLQFKGWRSLAIEISAGFETESALQLQMVAVVNRCLQANSNSTLPEKVFGHLLLSRAALALITLQRLVACKIQTRSIKSVLSNVWTAIRGCGQNFELAFVGDTTSYYRTLLKILLLAIQPYIYMKAPRQPDTSQKKDARFSTSIRDNLEDAGPILLEITTDVVAKGFHSLATTLHETPRDVMPSDLGLLTALLQSVLHIDGIHILHPQIALRLSDANAGRYAAALFSWSDHFTADEGDPVFGELSISFLVDMSCIQPQAEFLAAEGLLAQLSTANIMRAFREGRGAGPLDSPQRLHVIWAKGILPLCLNLLTAVGESFAPEVAGFLNNFVAQLSRSKSYLDIKSAPSALEPSASRITLNVATELHTLALLSVILGRFRAAPAASAIGEIEELAWDSMAVKADLEAWLNERRAGLKGRIVATTEQEVQMARMPPVQGNVEGGGDNRLVEKVISELAGALACLSVVI